MLMSGQLVIYQTEIEKYVHRTNYNTHISTSDFYLSVELGFCSHLLNHCWKSYTGYRFANTLTTSWPYWRTTVQGPEHINSCIPQPSHQTSTRHLRSSSTPLLHRPTTRTHFADRAFRCSVPAVWNSLNT